MFWIAADEKVGNATTFRGNQLSLPGVFCPEVALREGKIPQHQARRASLGFEEHAAVAAPESFYGHFVLTIIHRNLVVSDSFAVGAQLHHSHGSGIFKSAVS